MIEVSKGGKRDAKKPTHKRVAKSPENAPKLKRMKKIKVNASDDAIYKQYCCTNYHIKDPPEGEPLEVCFSPVCVDKLFVPSTSLPLTGPLFFCNMQTSIH